MENKTQRKHFKFYKSYYDVFCELPNDKEKIAFIEAIFQKQFYNIETELKGMAKFAYISQKHNIENQVQGFIDKMGEIDTPMPPPPLGGMQGGMVPPPLQPVTDNIQHTTYNEILEFFNSTTWTKLKLTDNKKKQIKERLNTFSIEEIKIAIKNRMSSEWHIKDWWTTDWDSLFRNDEKIDKMLNIKTEVPIKTVKRTFNFLTGEQL